MMVHCTVVQPFIVIVGSIELQSSERTEPQGDCSWVELWAAGRGGCCCCLATWQSCQEQLGRGCSS